MPLDLLQPSLLDLSPEHYGKQRFVRMLLSGCLIDFPDTFEVCIGQCQQDNQNGVDVLISQNQRIPSS